MKARLIFFFIIPFVFANGQADDWMVKGETLYKKSQFDESLALFEKAYNFYKEQDNNQGLVNAALGLGYVYINLHKVSESIAHYKIAYTLSHENGWLEEEKEAADALSSTLYLTGQPQEAIPYALRCVKLGKALDDDVFYSTKLMELGYLYFQLGAIDSADILLHEALKIKQDINDKDGAIFVQNYLGEFYKSIGALEKAQELNFLNLNYWLEKKDSVKLVTTYFNIANIFFEMKDLEKSEIYAKESLALAENLGLILYKSFGIKRLAEINVERGNTKLALQQYRSLLEIYEVTDHKTRMADALLKLATIHLDRSEVIDASSYLERAISYVEKTEDLRTKIKLLLVQSRILHQQGKHRVALKHAQQAYQKAFEVNLQNEKMDAALLVSEVYASLNNPEEALEWHQKYALFKDSLSQESQQNSIHELETKFRVSQNQDEIQRLSAENEIADLRLNSAYRNQLLLISGISLLAFIAGISFFFYRTKKRDNALLEEKNAIIKDALNEKELLVQEIHHRVKNNLQTISSLLNMQSFQLKNPEALAAIRKGESRIKSMALIHENLFKDEKGINLKASEYIEKLALNLFDTYNINPENIELNLDIDDVVLDIDRMIAVGLILNELISNSLKHAFPGDQHGLITIKLTNKKQSITLQVKDNGRGIPENYAMGKTLGFQIIKDFVKKLNGQLIVINSAGTEINISIPKVI